MEYCAAMKQQSGAPCTDDFRKIKVGEKVESMPFFVHKSKEKLKGTIVTYHCKKGT